MKQKVVALVLCWFFGWLGAHKFYLGQAGVGMLYVLFCWTFIPGLVAFVEFWILLFMSEAEFNRQFNLQLHSSRAGADTVASASETTKALVDLKNLYDAGVITPEEYEEKRRNLLRRI